MNQNRLLWLDPKCCYRCVFFKVFSRFGILAFRLWLCFPLIVSATTTHNLHFAFPAQGYETTLYSFSHKPGTQQGNTRASETEQLATHKSPRTTAINRSSTDRNIHKRNNGDHSGNNGCGNEGASTGSGSSSGSLLCFCCCGCCCCFCCC